MVRQIYKRQHIEIVPMGVDPQFHEIHEDKDIQIDGILPDEKMILYVGRLIDWKGVDTLIKAMPRVLDWNKKIKVLLIGSGPDKGKLTGLCKDLRIENRVVFIDKIPQNELIKYYTRANLFILPSLINSVVGTEGLGLVMIAAMACGTPVIGSDVGGIPDIVKDGETGLLAKPADPDDLGEKMIQLLSDNTLQRKVIDNGMKLVKQDFSWDVIADRFIEIYTRVVKGNKLCYPQQERRMSMGS